MCRSKKQPQGRKRSQRVAFVGDPGEDSVLSDSEDIPLLNIQVVKPMLSKPGIMLDITVDARPLQMELDTVSIISERTWSTALGSPSLTKSDIRLKTYTGQNLKVVGQKIAMVRYGSQERQLPLIVVAGNGPSLFGRNWLCELQLDWGHIKKVVAPLEQLLQEYEEVFRPELGTLRGIQANLEVEPDARPRFHKPRSVPYTIKGAIERDLERLEKIGVLEKVKYSDWAAPIVPVPKSDGGIRICGDYKVTINPQLEVHQYPVPTAEDLFATLSGGQTFSKLDLSQAYQQVVLEPTSRKPGPAGVRDDTEVGTTAFNLHQIEALPLSAQQLKEATLKDPQLMVVDLVPDFGTGTLSCALRGEASKACPRGTITYTCTTTTTNVLVWDTSLTVNSVFFISSSPLLSTLPLVDSSMPAQQLFQAIIVENGTTLVSNLTVQEEFRDRAEMGAVSTVTITCRDNITPGATERTETLQIADVPSPPINVTRSPRDLCSGPLDSITVEWECPTSTGGTDITRYTVVVVGLRNYTVEDGRSVDIAGVAQNITYTVFVVAENCIGESAVSYQTSIFNSTVPDTPTVLTYQIDCSELTSNTIPIEIFWQNQALPCPVTQVCVNCCGGSCLSECRSTSINPYRIDNSSSGENYTVHLSLVNGIGRSGLSDPLQFDITHFFQIEVSINHQSVECQLPLSFAGVTQCNIRYGVDSTYEDLPYVDESSGGTGGGSNVTVLLTHQLQPLTTYYYVAFANSSSMCAKVLGSFSTGCSHANLGFMETIQDGRCSGLQGSTLLTGGIVCYNGVTPGSIAVYNCNATHHLEGSNIRVCQRNGNWSGSIPQCVAIPTEVPVSTTIGLGAGAVVGVSITIFLLSFTLGALLAAFICGLRWRGKSSGQPHPSPSEGPQPGPVYEAVQEPPVDILELKDNIAYGPVRSH